MLFLATVSHYQRDTFTVTYVMMDGGILGLKSEALLNYVGSVCPAISTVDAEAAMCASVLGMLGKK